MITENNPISGFETFLFGRARGHVRGAGWTHCRRTCHPWRAMPTPTEKGPERSSLRGAQFIGLGIEMVVPIVLLMYVGYRLDAWLGSKPWLFLLGALLGIAVGFYGMFKRVGIIGNRSGEKR